MNGENDLTFESVLLEYDGPLMALYRKHDGDPVILSWVDQVFDQNVWLAMEPGKDICDAFCGGSVGYLTVYDHSKDNAHLVDIDGDGKWSNKRPFVFTEHPEYIGEDDFYL